MKFLILLFVFSQNAHAFNPEACKAEFTPKYQSDRTAWMTTSTSDGTTLLTDATILPTVSVNASSSKNGCSPINKSYNEMADFFGVNYDAIKIESARGQGEFIVAMAKLFRCPDESLPDFQKELQKNYKNIYEPEKKRNVEETFHSLVFFMQSFKKLCPNIGAFNYIHF